MQNRLILNSNKLKSGIKNCTEVTLSFSSNVIHNSYDETNFGHELFLTTTQDWRLCKAFANGSSANINLSNTELSKMVQLEGFLWILLGPSLKLVYL